MVETLAFQFPYHGGRYSEIFNSDGNLTFEEADSESTRAGSRVCWVARRVSRRISPISIPRRADGCSSNPPPTCSS